MALPEKERGREKGKGGLKERKLDDNKKKKLTPKKLKKKHKQSEDPLVREIAQQLLTDREGHDKTAAEWTRRYAQG